MKSYQLVIEPEAVEDIQEALNYYAEIYGNLGRRFKDSVDKTLEQIKKNPFYQIRYNGNIRWLHLKKFPYSIHYIIDDLYDNIHILAIIHTASDPDKTWLWQEE
jgi:toxin ParE1/3/4